MNNIENIVIEPENTANSAVIWLHGLGADGHDFEPLVPLLELKSTRFIFPHAPIRQVTVNAGMEMRAWYDIVSMDFNTAGNTDDIETSVSQLQLMINDQIDNGISAERIVLAGFSQGGVIALIAGLSCKHHVAGVMALSTYIPMQFREKNWLQKPDVLMCHGRQDPVIPFSIAESSFEYLLSEKVDVQFRAWDMQHQLIDEEITFVKQWLHNKLSQGG